MHSRERLIIEARELARDHYIARHMLFRSLAALDLGSLNEVLDDVRGLAPESVEASIVARLLEERYPAGRRPGRRR